MFWAKVNDLNNKIAANATLAMSTMWCVYLFFLWSLLPLISHSLQGLAMYVSSTVIQLVALPLIMVGQSVLSKEAESRAILDHTMIKQQFADMKELIIESQQEIDLLRTVLHNQQAQINMLTAIAGATGAVVPVS